MLIKKFLHKSSSTNVSISIQDDACIRNNRYQCTCHTCTSTQMFKAINKGWSVYIHFTLLDSESFTLIMNDYLPKALPIPWIHINNNILSSPPISSLPETRVQNYVYDKHLTPSPLAFGVVGKSKKFCQTTEPSEVKRNALL